jgi:hypothetical protein
LPFISPKIEICWNLEKISKIWDTVFEAIHEDQPQKKNDFYLLWFWRNIQEYNIFTFYTQKIIFEEWNRTSLMKSTHVNKEQLRVLQMIYNLWKLYKKWIFDKGEYLIIEKGIIEIKSLPNLNFLGIKNDQMIVTLTRES